jgi:putative peptidoglycan lipid II flippase
VQALIFYAPALFAHSGIEILSRGFYALSDTRTPVLVAAGSMLLNLVLAALLVGPLELRGLALALSLATTAEVLALAALIAVRVDGVLTAQFFGALLRMAAATALGTAGAAAVLLLLTEVLRLDIGATLGALAVLATAGGAGILVYMAAAWRLGLQETSDLRRRLPVGGST